MADKKSDSAESKEKDSSKEKDETSTSGRSPMRTETTPNMAEVKKAIAAAIDAAMEDMKLWVRNEIVLHGSAVDDEAEREKRNP